MLFAPATTIPTTVLKPHLTPETRRFLLELTSRLAPTPSRAAWPVLGGDGVLPGSVPASPMFGSTWSIGGAVRGCRGVCAVSSLSVAATSMTGRSTPESLLSGSWPWPDRLAPTASVVSPSDVEVLPETVLALPILKFCRWLLKSLMRRFEVSAEPGTSGSAP